MKILCRSIIVLFFSLCISPLFSQEECDDTVPILGLELEIVGPNFPADPNIYPGDEFCINLIVTNFTNIDLIQLVLGFDPSVIEFIVPPMNSGETNPTVGSNLMGSNIGSNTTRVDQGVLNLIWTNPFGGASTLTDGDIFAELCFEAKAAPGECTSLLELEGTVFNPPLFTTVQSAESPTEFCIMDSIAFNIANNEVCIGCDRPTVSDLNICNSNGSFCFSTCGLMYPIYSAIETPGPTLLDTFDSENDLVCQSNLPSGFYNIVLTDDSGGTNSLTFFEIDRTIPSISIDTTLKNPRCFNTRDGEIGFNLNGGTPDYSIQLSNGVVYTGDSGLMENLGVGSYAITVTDALGCSETMDNIILETPPIEVETMVDSFFCLLDSDGQISATASGGSPFPGGEYEFNNGMPSTSFTQIDPMGTFSFVEEDTCFNLKVRDNRGCVIEECVHIPIRNNLPLKFDTIPPDCSRSGYSASIELVNFPPIGIFQSCLTKVGTGTVLTAAGGMCAFVGLGAGCGNPNDTGVYLGPGEYEWNIKLRDPIDINNILCSESYFFTIPDFVVEPLEITTSSTQPDCGMDNGTATLAVSGGAGGYSYEWEYDPTLDQPTLTNLPSGIYDVTITDSSGCEKDTFVDLEQGVFLTIEAMLNTDLDCSDPTVEAEMEVSFSGFPEADLTFNWYTENEAGLSSTPTLTTDTAGVYIIEVATFFNVCVVTDTVIVEEPTSITFESRVQKPADCDVNNPVTGEIEIFDIQGGSGIYLCRWTYEGVELLDSFTHLRTDLIAGTYEIVIIDNNTGCRATEIIELLSDDEVDFTVEPTPPTCPGWDDGLIAVQGIPGGPTLMCIWDDPTITTTTCVATNLTAGSYLVTIIDENNCKKDSTITLEDPTIFTAEVDVVSDVSCYDGNDGVVTASVLTNPDNSLQFGYVWSNGDANSDGLESTNTNFGAGDQSVILSDENGCTVELDFTISEPMNIALDPDTKTGSTLCNEECNAEINLTATGGTINGGDYTYTWELDGQEAASRNDLCVGSYPVVISDELGCEVVDTVVITEADSITILVTKANISCQDSGAGGSITLAASGGCDNFTYQWSPNVSDNEIGLGLDEGSYSITVTDDCGCTQIVEEEISGDTPISAEVVITPDKPACAGQRVCLGINQATISGGTGLGYTFTYQGGLGDGIPIDSCVDVLPGPYAMSVFDSDGCQTDLGIINVPQPDTFAVDLGPDIDIDIGDGAIEIFADITANSVITDIIWMPTDGWECIDSSYCDRILYTPSTNNTIIVEIFDENGCKATDEVNINFDSPRRVYMPTAFDPSSSIDNRFMLLTGKGVERIEDLLIYDRWGNLVFMLEDSVKDFPHSKDDGWDGRKDNRDCESGVYVWVANVTFTDGQTLKYKGQITLLR